MDNTESFLKSELDKLNVKNEDISANANFILNKLIKNKKMDELIYVKEHLSHDGYDRDGPKSDLWDLYFIGKKDETYTIYSYHYEYWYYAVTNDIGYELYEKKDFLENDLGHFIDLIDKGLIYQLNR